MLEISSALAPRPSEAKSLDRPKITGLIGDLYGLGFRGGDPCGLHFAEWACCGPTRPHWAATCPFGKLQPTGVPSTAAPDQRCDKSRGVQCPFLKGPSFLRGLQGSLRILSKKEWIDISCS